MSMRYHFEPNRIAVTLGTMVEGDLPRLDAHIFLKDKASWFVLADDGAERLEEFPAGFDQRMEDWKAGQKKNEEA